MFTVNGNPILESDMDVLLTLKSHLFINGISLFESMKDGDRNIQVSCPVHANGQERKPSCGISTVSQKAGNKITPTGTVHCFTCGYTATLEEMISYCFGKDDKGEYGKQWLVKNFLTVSVENRKPLPLNLSRGVKTTKQEQKFITEQELASYRYYHEYMYKRRLTNEVIEMYDIGHDNNFILEGPNGQKYPPMECITFPARDINGNTLFIARRAINSKLFHYPAEAEKPVYGIYELTQMEPFSELVVCESAIDALTSVVYGKPAVALFGLGTVNQYKQLLQIPCRKFISGFDSDVAGQKAADKLKTYMKGKRLTTQLEIPAGKDINDLEQEEFLNLGEIF